VGCLYSFSDFFYQRRELQTFSLRFQIEKSSKVKEQFIQAFKTHSFKHSNTQAFLSTIIFILLQPITTNAFSGTFSLLKA